jgi:hypothetical protein
MIERKNNSKWAQTRTVPQSLKWTSDNDDYLSYKRNVPRWVPRWTPWNGEAGAFCRMGQPAGNGIPCRSGLRRVAGELLEGLLSLKERPRSDLRQGLSVFLDELRLAVPLPVVDIKEATTVEHGVSLTFWNESIATPCSRRRRADGRDRCRRLPPPRGRDAAGTRPLKRALIETKNFSEISHDHPRSVVSRESPRITWVPGRFGFLL